MNSFKHPRLGAAELATAAALIVMPGAQAAVIDLTLTGPIAGDTLGPESTSNPCIIAGTTCPQQPLTFGYNNFKQTGNQTSYDLYSTTPTDQVADGVQGNPYPVGQINGITNNNPFVIAIDVNTADHLETLDLFEVIVGGSLFAHYVGPTLIDPLNNGNG